MALVPADIAPVVTNIGFYKHWVQLVKTGMTHQAAYEATETVHEQILGWRMHRDFKTFDRKAWRYKKVQGIKNLIFCID